VLALLHQRRFVCPARRWCWRRLPMDLRSLRSLHLVELLAYRSHRLLPQVRQDRLERLGDLPPERLLDLWLDGWWRETRVRLVQIDRTLVDDGHRCLRRGHSVPRPLRTVRAELDRCSSDHPAADGEVLHRP
jgi:hypothetical protein